MLVFDFEVFRYDWLVVFKDTTSQEYHTIVNNREQLRQFYKDNRSQLHVGFNNKRYDNLVYRATLDGADPFRVNQMIIEHDNPIEVYRTWNLNKYWYPSMDVGQDTMRGSLKEFEGYLGLNIDETSVPFDIKRPLTEDELSRTIEYCISDVNATERLIEEFGDGLETKMNLIKEFDLGARELDNTNAQLSAKALGAQATDFNDEYEPFPFENHDITLPKHYGDVKQANTLVGRSTIYDFYNKAPNYTHKLHIELAGVPHILAYGGIHGARNNFIYEGEMWLLDVKGYYPSIMIEYDYLSRAVPKAKRYIYKDIVAERDIAKAKKDYKQDNILKLVANTTFGASKAKFNDLYDPRQANNICIAGQLMLVDLIESVKDYAKIIQLTTWLN